jgi:hypothetical protein
MLVNGIPVIILGDTALTAAQQIQEAAEKRIRLCTRAIYDLLFFGIRSRPLCGRYPN